MDREEKLYMLKRVDRALTVSILALIGAFVPLVGIFLILIAVGIISGVEPFNKRMRDRKRAVEIIIVIAFILSLVAGYVWFSYWQNRQNETLNQQQSSQTINDSLTTQKATEDAVSKLQLNECLDAVEDWYNENRKNVTTIPQEQNLLELRRQQVDECRLRYE